MLILSRTTYFKVFRIAGFLIVWGHCCYSVSAQIGYEYFTPQKPFSSSSPQSSTLTNVPVFEYTSGTIAPSTTQSLVSDKSSESFYVTQFPSENMIQQKKEPGRISGQPESSSRYPSKSSIVQGFRQSLAPRRLVPGILPPTFSKFPKLSGQMDEQYHGAPSVAQNSGRVGLLRHPGVTLVGEEPDVEGDYSAIPGSPGVDYPLYSDIPTTSFRCEKQTYPGYYADVDTRCQVFHVCADNRTFDFLCPNGTIFHQAYLVCVWWNTFDCNLAMSLYNTNANIYDYQIRQLTDQFSAKHDDQIPGLPNTSGSVSLGRPGIKILDYSQVVRPSSLESSEKLAKSAGALRDKFLNNVYQKPSKPGVLRLQANIYSDKPNDEGSVHQDEGIKATTLLPPGVSPDSGYTEKSLQPLDYSFKSHRLYDYPHELHQVAKFVSTTSPVETSFQGYGFSHGAPGVAEVGQGSNFPNYGIGALKTSGFPIDGTRGQGLSAEDAQLLDFPRSGSQLPGYSIEQSIQQQPIGEYLPPVNK